MNSIKKILVLFTMLSLFLTACGSDDSAKKDDKKDADVVEKEDKKSSKDGAADKILACLTENEEFEATEEELEEFVDEAGGDSSDNSYRDETTRLYLDQGSDEYTTELVLTKVDENVYNNCYIATKAEEVVELETGGNIVVSFNGGYNYTKETYMFIPSMFLFEDATQKFLTTFEYDEDEEELIYVSGDEELNDEELLEILLPVAEDSNEFNKDVFERTFGTDRD